MSSCVTVSSIDIELSGGSRNGVPKDDESRLISDRFDRAQQHKWRFALEVRKRR